MHARRSFGRVWVAVLFLSWMAALLPGCDGAGVIKGVSPKQPLPAIDNPVTVVVSGTGKCREMRIDWGDTLRNDYAVADLASNPEFTHTYGGWGGGKTVTVEGTIGCTGKVNTRFNIEPIVYKLGFNQIPNRPTAQTCVPVPNHPGAARNNLVQIVTKPVPQSPGGINFGCPFGGCVYDADGKPGSVATAPFPFPGMKEFSLVVKVASQRVQGGTNMRFTTNDTGFLEMCLNDSDMTNNSGGYEIHITVDQLGP